MTTFGPFLPVTGVYWNPRTDQWVAQIGLDEQAFLTSHEAWDHIDTYCAEWYAMCGPNESGVA